MSIVWNVINTPGVINVAPNGYLMKISTKLITAAFLLFFSTGILKLNAQFPDVFPTSGVEWGCVYRTTDPINPFSSDVGFRTAFDTLLNGVEYTYVEDYASVPRLIRVEGEQVYAKFMSACCESAEFLLYDFSLNAGDSTTIYGYSGQPDPYPAYVESVDSLLVGDQYRKKLRVVSGFQVFDFVQGVGALQGVFYCDLPMTDWMSELVCFSINGTAYALDGSGTTYDVSCWQTIDNKSHADSRIRVFPNPASNYLHIDGVKPVRVEIYNTSGKYVASSNSSIVDISLLNSGFYIVKVFDDLKNITTLRFIKE